MGKKKTNIKMTTLHSTFLTLLTCLVLCSCGSKPDSATEQTWQNSFREVLIDGYSNFRGHFVDSDVAVYIFSYQLPAQLRSKNLFSILRKRIPGYTAVAESDNELVFRRSGTLKGFECFDEYRLLADDQQKIVTVMFASLDSPVEMKNHQFYIDKLRKIHHTLSTKSN